MWFYVVIKMDVKAVYKFMKEYDEGGIDLA